MTEIEVLQEVDRKMMILINLMAYEIVEGKTLAEGAPLLRRLGLKYNEIAAIYGSSAKVVSVRLAEAKRKQSKRR